MDRFDNGVLIQSEVQRLGSAAGGQQGLMGMGLFEALHQTGPGRNKRDLLLEVALSFRPVQETIKNAFLLMNA